VRVTVAMPIPYPWRARVNLLIPAANRVLIPAANRRRL